MAHKYLTVGDLRRALEGVSDEMLLAVNYREEDDSGGPERVVEYVHQVEVRSNPHSDHFTQIFVVESA